MEQVSERVLATDAPVIVKTKQLMAGASGVLSLAQGAYLLEHCTCTLSRQVDPRNVCNKQRNAVSGAWPCTRSCGEQAVTPSGRSPYSEHCAHVAGVVHWAPPAAALEAAAALVGDARVSAYGPCNGLPELVWLDTISCPQHACHTQCSCAKGSRHVPPHHILSECPWR